MSPTTAAHVAAQLGDAVPTILDGGECRVGVESTIVSFLADVPVLLRPGAITLEMLEAELGPVRVGVDTPLPTAPGQLRVTTRHARRSESSTTSQRSPRRISALLSCAPVDTFGPRTSSVSPSGDLEVAATHLFAALRAPDRGGFRRVTPSPSPRSASAAPS